KKTPEPKPQLAPAPTGVPKARRSTTGESNHGFKACSIATANGFLRSERLGISTSAFVSSMGPWVRSRWKIVTIRHRSVKPAADEGRRGVKHLYRPIAGGKKRGSRVIQGQGS